MAKRTLDDVFNDDPLGLLEVSVTKSKRLSHYAIYYETFEELKSFIENNGSEPDIEASNIHEAKLAARLSKLRSTPEALEALAPFDTEGLLGNEPLGEKKTELKTAITVSEICNFSISVHLYKITQNIFKKSENIYNNLCKHSRSCF